MLERGGFRVLVDAAAIEPAAEGRVRAWLRFDYPQTQPASGAYPAYRSRIERRLVDCNARTSGVELVTLHDQPGGAGAPLRGIARSDAPPMQASAAGTVGAVVIDAVCRQR